MVTEAETKDSSNTREELPTVLESQELLQRLKEEFPQYQYRVGKRNRRVQRLYGKTWLAVCIHKKRRSRCKECGGSSICIHKKLRSQCKECDGGSICIHKKQRSQCKECGGGSICIHKKLRSRCKECDGGSICIHKKRRSQCKECDGSSICMHNRQRSQCKECDGSSFVKCKEDDCEELILKNGRSGKDGYCLGCYYAHNPSDETPSGVSDVGCNWIDDMERELGIKIKHWHHNRLGKCWVGSEYRLPEWSRKTVDGYCEESNTVYEFHGDYYHGHPRFWKERPYLEDKFWDTEQKMHKMKKLGYNVVYIWESEYYNRKESSSAQRVSSLSRVFVDSLEYSDEVVHEETSMSINDIRVEPPQSDEPDSRDLSLLQNG